MSIFRISLAVVLVTGLRGTVGLCQYENLIGLTPSGEWGDCLYANANSLSSVYLVLIDPVNRDFGEGEVRDVALVSGFEIRMQAYGTGAIAALRPSIPGSVITRDGTYGVQYAEALVVSAGLFTVLAEVDIFAGNLEIAGHGLNVGIERSPMPCDGATGLVYLLAPVPSSIPGSLVYFDAEDDVGPAVAASAWSIWPTDPDLRIQVITVGTDADSWGSIKAIYR